MNRIVLLLLVLLFAAPWTAFAAHTDGRILLDVENNGEAWYVSPVDGRRYDLGRPEQALEVMRVFGLGITNADLAQIPTNNDDFTGDYALRQRLSGRILIQVQGHGEAWYVNPVDLKRYYLGRPEDALEVMSSLGLGITSADLAAIQTGSVHMPDIYYNIPFAAQAPFGEWGDARQQEGCEETSALMAMKWVTGEPLSLEEARTEILAMSDWQKKEFGYFEDTSAHDTATRLFNRWFDYTNVSVEYDISSTDVLDELEAGNVVLVTINGKKVNHGFYTPPGPDRHMLLVHGYDTATGELIYHDPGTQHGENLRATFAEMDYMLRDYVSGVYAPITSERTAMIVVRK